MAAYLPLPDSNYLKLKDDNVSTTGSWTTLTMNFKCSVTLLSKGMDPWRKSSSPQSTRVASISDTYVVLAATVQPTLPVSRVLVISCRVRPKRQPHIHSKLNRALFSSLCRTSTLQHNTITITNSLSNGQKKSSWTMAISSMEKPVSCPWNSSDLNRDLLKCAENAHKTPDNFSSRTE
jgi:hypothetical protein